MSEPFFPEIEAITHEGPDSENPARLSLLRRRAIRAREVDARAAALRRLLLAQLLLARRRRLRRGDASRAPGSRGATPLELAEHKLSVAFEFFEKLGAPFFCFHDRDLAPEGRYAGREPVATSTHMIDERAGRDGAHGSQAALGHRQPLRTSPLRGRCGHQPRSRGLRLRRRTGEAVRSRRRIGSAARTTCCGAAARATTRCSTPICGARSTSSGASCSWSSSTSTRSASRARS